MDYQYQKKPLKQQPREPELKRAKLKALRLLERMDRTEAQLREKLLGAEFEPAIAEQAIDYVKSFGYLDDERYVRNYIEYRSRQKSRRQIEQELLFRKGVSKELILKVYEELEDSDEKALIRRQLEKKHYHPAKCDERQRQKLTASLLRKGFRMGDILSVMKEAQESDPEPYG
ncbi:MAG: recombination regulator RecX [Lachnospiraceae bacterium]